MRAIKVQTSLPTWLNIIFIEALLKICNIDYRKYLSFVDLVVSLYVQISATGARTLGMGAALVEILAQEMRTCNNFHVQENLQQALADSNGRRQNHAAECCGCSHHDAKSAGTYTLVAVSLLVTATMTSYEAIIL